MPSPLFTRWSAEARRQAREHIRNGAALDPLSDIVFKSLLAANNPDSREACRCLLSACTRRTVASLVVRNHELLPEHLTGKTIRLDVLLSFNDGEKADLEMQMRKTPDDLRNRSAVYASKLLSGQPRRGRGYATVKRVYQIFFLNFTLFPGSDKIPRRYSMREEDEHDELTNLITTIFYELPKLEKVVGECLAGRRDLEGLPNELKWGMYFKHRNDERTAGLIEELCRTEEGIMRAERALKRISLTERLWDWKYAREKRAWDYASVMDAIREQGLEQGLETGLEQGLEKGRAEAVRRLQKYGMEPQQIAEALELPLDTVLRRLKAE